MKLLYGEPLWRRIANGPSEPTRRVTGGSEPENPGCLANPEVELPSTPVPGDPCQGPFAARTSGGIWNGGENSDYVPRLSANGNYVAFLASAPLISEGAAFGIPGSAFNSDAYREDMTAPTRASGLQRLSQFASGDTTRISTNADVLDLGISPDGQQVAFSTRRTAFPLGTPAFVSSPSAVPGLVELFEADVADETLTRVTRGYEGGVPEHSELESANEDRYTKGSDGSLSPSFDASGQLLTFSSTASNLVFGDGNSPANSGGRSRRRRRVSRAAHRLLGRTHPSSDLAGSRQPVARTAVPADRHRDLARERHGPAQGSRPRGRQARRERDQRPAGEQLARAQEEEENGRTSVGSRTRRHAGEAEPPAHGSLPRLGVPGGRAARDGHGDVLREGPSDAAQDARRPLRSPHGSPAPEEGPLMGRRITLILLLALLAVALVATSAAAAPLADDGGAEWQVEQPLPPPPALGGVETSEAPVSLGHIGDIEFYEHQPNRGVLITSGNGGSVEPGVWFYNGAGWKELSNKCGATDGRIAWAGPDEFWTVSDGRAGQTVASGSERPPREDNTLCHFAPGPKGNIEIVGSYASVPFLGSSYQAMHAAACLAPNNCWFGGEPLPPPQVGAFMLHWNGSSLEPQPFLPEGHPVRELVPFESHLDESMRIQPGDKFVTPSSRPPALRTIKAEVSGEESFFE